MGLYRSKNQGIGLIFALFIGLHLYRISEGPNGFHRWRESDTAAVAENFWRESWNILQPRVDDRRGTDGIVGAEFPIYNYTVALAYGALGFKHLWPRLLSVFSGLFFLWGVGRLARFLLGQDPWLEVATIWLCGFAPLLFFYARKIQPDVLAVAMAVNGFAFFVSWLRTRQWKDFLAASLCLAVASLIKPTMLCVGFGMLAYLLEVRGMRALKDWRNYGLALLVFLPSALWFRYALALNRAQNSGHFYLGQNVLGDLVFLGNWNFYQHVFLTWLWELQIGLPVAWIFLVGLYALRRHPLRRVLLVWVLGCFMMFCFAAGHCATEHDYYTLPIVAPLGMITALGLREILQKKRPGLTRAALVCVALLPLYTVGRLKDRYGKPYDFEQGRAAADKFMDAQKRIVTYEDSPAILFYRVGRKGWAVMGTKQESILRDAIVAGVRKLVLSEPALAEVRQSPYAPYLGEPVYEDQGILVLGLHPVPLRPLE